MPPDQAKVPSSENMHRLILSKFTTIGSVCTRLSCDGLLTLRAINLTCTSYPIVFLQVGNLLLLVVSGRKSMWWVVNVTISHHTHTHTQVCDSETEQAVTRLSFLLNANVLVLLPREPGPGHGWGP